MKTEPSLSLLVFRGLLGTAAPAPAQQAPEEGQPQEIAALPGPPGAFQIATRAQILADSAAQAEQMVQRLAVVEGLTAEVGEAERRHRELQALLALMIEADFVRLERLSRLRDQALLEDGRLEAVRDRLIDRLTELGDAHAAWIERRQLWRSWLEALRAKIARLGALVTTIQARRRQALLERAEPLLLSEEHRAQLREGGWRAWDPTTGIDPWAYLAFARANLRMLGFHVLLALLIGAVARAGRLAAARERGGGVVRAS